MSSVVISGDTSGAITLAAPAVSGTNTATLPAATGTVMVSGNMPAFSAYLGSNQTLSANTDVIVPFDSEEFDTANCFNTSTYRFTPTVAGYYQLNWATNIYIPTTGEAQCALYKNGSIYKITTDMSMGTSGAQWNQCGSSLVYANGSTDYFQIRAYQNSGASRTLYGGNTWSTWFNGILVRTA